MTILRRFTILILALLPAVPGVWAQAGSVSTIDDARRPRSSGDPVLPGIWRLRGDDPQLPRDDDLEPLGRLIGKASVVGFGESFHTSSGFYRMKHRVFRFLVEKMGFRAFAFESPWTNADRVADYVQTCAGSPEEALHGLFGVWQSTETRDLVQWMCEWNRTHSDPADRLYFFGFDIQQPNQDGPALIAYLERVGIPRNHPWIAGIMVCDDEGSSDPSPGEVSVESYAQCTQSLREIDDYFQRNADRLQQQTSKMDFGVANLRLMGLRAWEDASFYFDRNFNRSFSARDAGMAYALLVLRALRFPRVKVVVWAHNDHIARGDLQSGERPMGNHLAAVLGSFYVNFALAAYQTSIDFPGTGCGPRQKPRGNSVEKPLYKLHEEALLVDLLFPGTTKPYLPKDTYILGERKLIPHDLYNGILFLESSPKMHPLFRPPCQ